MVKTAVSTSQLLATGPWENISLKLKTAQQDKLCIIIQIIKLLNAVKLCIFNHSACHSTAAVSNMAMWSATVRLTRHRTSSPVSAAGHALESQLQHQYHVNASYIIRKMRMLSFVSCTVCLQQNTTCPKLQAEDLHVKSNALLLISTTFNCN